MNRVESQSQELIDFFLVNCDSSRRAQVLPDTTDMLPDLKSIFFPLKMPLPSLADSGLLFLRRSRTHDCLMDDRRHILR